MKNIKNEEYYTQKDLDYFGLHPCDNNEVKYKKKHTGKIQKMLIALGVLNAV